MHASGDAGIEHCPPKFQGLYSILSLGPFIGFPYME
jgi:hypothetical protein